MEDSEVIFVLETGSLPSNQLSGGNTIDQTILTGSAHSSPSLADASKVKQTLCISKVVLSMTEIVTQYNFFLKKQEKRRTVLYVLAPAMQLSNPTWIDCKNTTCFSFLKP